ncbi:hypothetical protein FACS1894153_2050 [Bacteroidia bacterium]|nr:hypothetical protein FACS1894153_2050 [Bacteroidia bacterium]
MKKLLSILTLFFIITFCYSEVPAGYYDSAEGKIGANLKTSLYNIIKNHSARGYGALWTAYSTTDRKQDGSIWDMYSNIKWTYSSDQCGNYSSVGDCYNREHSFPKSWFNDAAPMENDCIHIVPTDGKVNGMRSNHPYGEVETATFPSTSSDKEKVLGKLGSCKSSIGYSGTVFEPDDEYKGDFARIYFYMATRYENIFASWVSNAEAKPMLAGNAYPGYKTWVINMLLKWHNQDPVSQKEIDRNNAVYAFQNNRNPYVDHPDWADSVWAYKGNPANTLENIQTNLQLNIFPNPTSGDVINIENDMLQTGDRIEVYDMQGRIVMMKISSSSKYELLDISSLSNGFYVVLCNGNQGKFSKVGL